MKNRRVASAAVASVLAAGAITPAARAQGSSELEQLKAQLQALQQKVEELEKQQAAQQETQDRTTDAIAQARANTGEWVSRFQWKGDLRYRVEGVDPEEATTDQTRQRIRARIGLTAKINDTVSGTVQLATNGGNDDPRSTNQTLGDGFDRKGIGFDLAYLEWKPGYGLSVMAGKTTQPFTKVPTFFFDNDITPEGVSMKWQQGGLFASAFGYSLGERSTASDASLLGGQVGFKQSLGGVTYTGAIGYFDVGSVEGEVTAQPNGCTSTPNPAFFGGAQGNTTVTVAGCPRLANDFNMIDIIGQAEFAVGAFPLAVFGEYVQNQEADDLDTGYALGFTVGKASNPQTWEVGYAYQSTEKDAWFGQFVDSDFGGGLTDVDGSVFRFSYAPARNWLFNGTYFLNDRFVDVGTQRDYKRYQLDMVFRF
jgi:hypothetical protein